MKKRKGKIKISRLFIKDIDPSLFIVFSQFFPVYIEDIQFNNYITYYGYCDQFAEISDGEKAPVYDAIITNDNGVYSVKFNPALL